MNRFFIVLVSAVLLGSISANGQRPTIDTVTFEGVDDYIFNASAANSSGCHGYNKFYDVGSIALDAMWNGYSLVYLRNLLNPGGEMSLDEFYHLYPELASQTSGRHLTGQEYDALEPMMVVGLSVCPTVVSDRESLSKLTSGPFNTHYWEWMHVVDTTMAGRLTEYVQLYTIEGGQPQFQAEGAWRLEDPHRYMLFSNWYDIDSYRVPPNLLHEDTIYVPLYEAMFGRGVLVDGKSYMLAGTHNNNGAIWTQECCDTIYDDSTICFEHSPTAYSCYIRNISAYCRVSRWLKYDTFPWWNSNSNWHCNDINIFPILDTLFGTPCAVVTGLQAVEVDSLWATLMWSADARQHEWEVAYRPAGDSLAGDMTVTVSVPTVTLTGLTPGTAYDVRVRGLCDTDNYSPWSDTLQLVTTFTPPDTSADTLPHIDPYRVGIGNLDRFTHITPNPAHDVVGILSSYQLVGVTVYGLTGRLLLEQTAEGMTATINVASLPRGTYILAVRTLQGVAAKKLVLR